MIESDGYIPYDVERIECYLFASQELSPPGMSKMPHSGMQLQLLSRQAASQLPSWPGAKLQRASELESLDMSPL